MATSNSRPLNMTHRGALPNGGNRGFMLACVKYDDYRKALRPNMYLAFRFGI